MKLCVRNSQHLIFPLIFLRTEALNAAGVLDDIPSFSSDGTENLKRRALTFASDFRENVRQRLGPEGLKGLMEKDRIATMGAATGAFVGFLV